jgi:hypothetical protein
LGYLNTFLFHQPRRTPRNNKIIATAAANVRWFICEYNFVAALVTVPPRKGLVANTGVVAVGGGVTLGEPLRDMTKVESGSGFQAGPSSPVGEVEALGVVKVGISVAPVVLKYVIVAFLAASRDKMLAGMGAMVSDLLLH